MAVIKGATGPEFPDRTHAGYNHVHRLLKTR